MSSHPVTPPSVLGGVAYQLRFVHPAAQPDGRPLVVRVADDTVLTYHDGLKALRAQCDWSAERFGAAGGRTGRSVELYESGKREPSARFLAALARALHPLGAAPDCLTLPPAASRRRGAKAYHTQVIRNVVLTGALPGGGTIRLKVAELRIELPVVPAKT